MGRLLGGEHASTPQCGVETPRLLKRSLPRLYYCCCCFVVFCFVWCGAKSVHGSLHFVGINLRNQINASPNPSAIACRTFVCLLQTRHCFSGTQKTCQPRSCIASTVSLHDHTLKQNPRDIVSKHLKERQHCNNQQNKKETHSYLA